MSEIGKSIRIERIIDRKSRNIVIIPMDHGISEGPVKGLVDLPKMVNKVAEGGANAVLLQKGIYPPYFFPGMGAVLSAVRFKWSIDRHAYECLKKFIVFFAANKYILK
jgi:hypothetical protein